MLDGTEPIDEDELAQRVALLRRFRELLMQQRERFQGYLATLEKQQRVIESGSADELLAYVELEEQMVADIFSIQKVIDPLEEMYRAAVPLSSAGDVPSLKTTLESLKNQAVTRSAHNRELLSTRMAEIRAEIKGLRNNPFANLSRSMYQNSVTASLVDISG
ncbi:MAG: flagellar biosynthesis protein FlgN [Treponema sp.]|nr:flagellar biosynthesis protein FlgN [Treponema sp.]